MFTFSPMKGKANCLSVCLVRAPTRSSSLPSDRTRSPEDTRTRRPITAGSWPTRPREDTTILRNTKTLSCRLGNQEVTSSAHLDSSLHRYKQTAFVAVVTAHAALPWCKLRTLFEVHFNTNFRHIIFLQREYFGKRTINWWNRRHLFMIFQCRYSFFFFFLVSEGFLHPPAPVCLSCIITIALESQRQVKLIDTSQVF